MKNIFDWLKEINFLKSPVSKFSNKDWDLWNSYMIHRFLSMNKDFLDIVNEVQSINPQNKKEIYTIYREFIPVNNKWNKYIKSNIKKHNFLFKFLDARLGQFSKLKYFVHSKLLRSR